ncbi:hypothetical protein EVU96_24880 [Bacillus infantis]|uniref:phage baseplate plug family protein n=1 Tax=Bacillus infantis TaxID=324767 RepID=UPI00101C17F8|nr:hypothetical protein [Bacillus infantis]RYI25203.1 hypothetical protein EVU96_24880 [Bacillus infantis]
MILPIEKEQIPYRFDIELASDLFTFEVHYNKHFDFFTLDIEKDGAALINGEKLVLNKPLFSDSVNVNLPKIKIIPKDRAGIERRITFDNLSETVFLYVE